MLIKDVLPLLRGLALGAEEKEAVLIMFPDGSGRIATTGHGRSTESKLPEGAFSFSILKQLEQFILGEIDAEGNKVSTAEEEEA